MTHMHKVVTLFDVDNTLLDNDRAQDDYKAQLAREAGPDAPKRYWEIFEALTRKLGYADYLGALERYRLEDMHDPKLLRMSSYLLDYPFADRLYPGALDVIAHAHAWGSTVILSDGDVVFQPRKIAHAGLWDAARGHVLIYIHKEQELADVQRRYPAEHYVMVDDKLRLLAAIKQQWGERVTTVWPKQGHYANDPNALKDYPPADVALSQIADLLEYDLSAIIQVARHS